jgi:hypothetical protein
MKRNYPGYILFIAFLACWVSGCATRPMIVTTTIGALDAREKLLIAMRGSEFKDKVLSNIINEFEKEHLFIEIIDLENLAEKSSRDYDAVVIMNEYKMFQIDERVRQFINGIDEDEQKKVVLLTTAGSPDMIGEDFKVDAISSASKIIEADALSNRIIQRVTSILSSR